jgi:glycosyltransferase involved in cell wall biosynthesis
MRIGVDARHLPEGRGVARYLQRTLPELVAAFPDDEWIALVPGSAPVTAPAGVRLVRPKTPGRLLFGLGATVGRPALERLLGGGLDAVWLPAPAPIGLDGSAPYVLTVHDLSFEERPGDYTAYERFWHRAGRLGRLARGAARVVAVSGPTRDAVVARWGVAPERVVVVSPGAGAAHEHEVEAHRFGRARDGRAEYLLFVGALEPRKAPELLAGAYARARARGLTAELWVAGAGRLADRLRDQPGVRMLGPVDGARLDSLYRDALAVVLPSWIEGFGLPPLEALARGVPAVVADLPVYQETLGTGALRFPAGDGDALAEALLRISSDPALRARLVADGRRAMAPLTWTSTAHGIRSALGAVASGA